MPAVFPCNVIDPYQLPLEYIDIYISFLFLIRLADFHGLPMDVPNPNVDRSCEVRANLARIAASRTRRMVMESCSDPECFVLILPFRNVYKYVQ